MSSSRVPQCADGPSIIIQGLLLTSLAALLVTLWTTTVRAQGHPEPAKYKLKQPAPIEVDESALRARWSYFPEGDELHDLAWSPTGDRIAVVRQVHWPDGGAAHNYPRWALRKLQERASVEPRFADPRIVILKPGSDTAVEVDYGWSPRFSPDGRRLAYARQDAAISGRRRMVAATGAGNPIVVFDLKTETKRVWATPEEGHQFLAPRWIDGDTLLVRDCYATNGQLLGCPGVIRVSRDGTKTPIPNTTKGRKRPTDSTAVFEWRDDSEGVALLRVGAGGTSMITVVPTNSEDFLLVNGTEASPIGARAQSALFVSGGRWHTVDLRRGKTKRRGRSPLVADGLEPNVFTSPRGRWVLFSSAPSMLGDGIYLTKALSKKATRIWSGPGVLMRAQWTPNEKKLAWIVSRRGAGDPDTRIAGDELIVFDFPRRPLHKSVPSYRWKSDWGSAN